MPNFTMTPPLASIGLFTFDPTETLKALYHITPPLAAIGLFTFDPTITLLPLYHLFPPVTGALNIFFDPRISQVTNPDQILKNEVRRVTT